MAYVTWTLREAARQLGYSHQTLLTYRSRHDDFPAPVGHRGQAALYDIDQLEAWLHRGKTVAVKNRRATRYDDGDAITCLECGARLQSLGQHLTRHGITAAEYRRRHNLPRTTALQSRRARGKHAATVTPDRAAQVQGGDGPGRSSASTAHTSTAHLRDGVAERRAPGQAKGVAAMGAAHRRRMDERMRGLGFRDLEDAVAATAHLSVGDAARRLRSAETSIRRWRHRFA